MGGEIKGFKDLLAWQKAYALCRKVYAMTTTMPSDERFGLTSQMRRAAVSVPSNIAEGYGRGSREDYLRFLRMARGSLFELDTQVMLARDLGFLDTGSYAGFTEDVQSSGQVLAGLIRSLEN